jgi:hypothetical protein
MPRHTLRLSGPGSRGARIAAPLLRDLLDTLVTGAEQAVRLRVEGRSTDHGKPPAWLDKAVAFDLVTIEAGSTSLLLEAPSLAEALSGRPAPSEAFVPFEAERSCLDLLADAMADALAGNEDSELFDNGLIATMSSLGKALRHGIDGIELGGVNRPLRMTSEGLDVLRRLRRQTPRDQQIILVGTLDSLRHSDRMFSMLLDTGEAVRGVLAGEKIDMAEVGTLWGCRVRVGGVAKFRPSGRVLRIEAAVVEPAAGEGSFFSRIPKPIDRRIDSRSLLQPQTPSTGVGAIFGTWPGDETDDDLLRMLKS